MVEFIKWHSRWEDSSIGVNHLSYSRNELVKLVGGWRERSALDLSDHYPRVKHQSLRLCLPPILYYTYMYVLRMYYYVFVCLCFSCFTPTFTLPSSISKVFSRSRELPLALTPSLSRHLSRFSLSSMYHPLHLTNSLHTFFRKVPTTTTFPNTAYFFSDKLVSMITANWQFFITYIFIAGTRKTKELQLKMTIVFLIYFVRILLSDYLVQNNCWNWFDRTQNKIYRYRDIHLQQGRIYRRFTTFWTLEKLFLAFLIVYFENQFTF